MKFLVRDTLSNKIWHTAITILVICTLTGCEKHIGVEDRPEGSISIGWAKDDATFRQNDWKRVKGYIDITPNLISGYLVNIHKMKPATIHCSIRKVTVRNDPNLLLYDTDDGIFRIRVENDTITGISIAGNSAFDKMME